MSRNKYYPPKERQYLYGKALQCIECGNTKAFNLALRLPYHIVVTAEHLETAPDENRLQRILISLEHNILNIVDRDINAGVQTIRCANCEAGFVDSQERLHDLCFHYGCPGCEVCGQYMEEVDVREICSECLLSNDGAISEEDCVVSCPWTDDGLSEVREHYGFTLEDLKTEMGY